jgi:hypothetical protein
MKCNFIFLAISCQTIFSQELFVVTDPPVMSQLIHLLLNVMQSAFKEQIKTGYNYHLMPEITYGIRI